MSIRIAVAQLEGNSDVPTAEVLAESASKVRSAMATAANAAARLVLFHEGALTYPHKRVMSHDPSTVGASQWERADWAAIKRELETIRDLAAELRLWTVMHGVHRLTGPNRPHNSLYVISDTGELIDRYDKRLLSNTEVSFMYTPGTRAVTFDVDGYRFGCLLCIEVQFPELLIEYALDDVDCILFSTSQSDDYPRLVEAHARLHSMWIATAMGAVEDATGVSGITAPDGRSLAQCASGPSVVTADLDREDPALSGALHGARWWRRVAREGGVHEAARRREDSRSTTTTAF